MGLLLVYPTAPRLPCFIETRRLRLFEDLYPIVCQCNDIIICKERIDTCGQTLFLMMVWYRGIVRRFVHCWLNITGIVLGTLPVRLIQRTWRRWAERRRLAVCMASHVRLGAGVSPLLVRVLHSLCVDDLALVIV